MLIKVCLNLFAVELHMYENKYSDEIIFHLKSKNNFYFIANYFEVEWQLLKSFLLLFSFGLLLSSIGVLFVNFSLMLTKYGLWEVEIEDLNVFI